MSEEYVFDGFNKEGTGVNFQEDHDVEVAGLGTLGEFSDLVGENGVTDIVDFGEDITSFTASEMGRVEIFEGNRLWLGGLDVLACLVEMAFGCFCGVGVVLLDVLGGEQRPTEEVACLCGLDPGGFDRVPTHGVYPLDGLFGCREVIDAVGAL